MPRPPIVGGGLKLARLCEAGADPLFGSIHCPTKAGFTGAGPGQFPSLAEATRQQGLSCHPPPGLPGLCGPEGSLLGAGVPWQAPA